MEIPNRVELRTETLECIERGITRSDAMREDIARRFGLISRHPTFINNHAWALVDLQRGKRIKKVAVGTYTLAEASTSGRQYAYGPSAPRHVRKADESQVQPPGSGTMPRWSRKLMRSANDRNAKTFFSTVRLCDDDMRALWDGCAGACALSGLPFSGERIGTGKAQRPFYPSLDRIDPEQPYSLENCRLVLQAVNFALNRFGDEVFLKIARATAQKHSGD